MIEQKKQVIADLMDLESDSHQIVEEQMQNVPGGVMLTIRGMVQVENPESGELEDTIVSQHVVWEYTNDCGVGALPVVGGDRIGWVTFVSV